MDSTEIFVVIAGIAAITFVLWYFSAAGRLPPSAKSGVQEIQVTVKGVARRALGRAGWTSVRGACLGVAEARVGGPLSGVSPESFRGITLVGGSRAFAA